MRNWAWNTRRIGIFAWGLTIGVISCQQTATQSGGTTSSGSDSSTSQDDTNNSNISASDLTQSGHSNSQHEDTGESTPSADESSSNTAMSDETGESTTPSTSDGDSTQSTDSDETTSTPGDDELIEVFTGAHVYFLSDDDNHRKIDSKASLPPRTQTYESIRGKLALRCPNDKCDHWDRFGSLYLVQHPGQPEEQQIELARFMTAYRVGFDWEVDLTDLRPLLVDDVTFRVYIDTWVGPGHAQGDGWLFDLALEFDGGIPDRYVLDVLPVWGDAKVEYGTPELPIADQIKTAQVELPAQTTSYALRSYVTGHGFGNADNCAEFCSRRHFLQLSGRTSKMLEKEIWRDDCSTTGVGGQQGTWEYARAGWCPGASVLPWVENVEVAESGDSALEVVYDVEDYENRCRPMVTPCTSCTAGVTCDDGHWLPTYFVSTLLIAYGDATSIN